MNENRAKSKKTGAKANEIISYITQPMILSRAVYVRIIGGFRRYPQGCERETSYNHSPQPIHKIIPEKKEEKY